MHKDTPTEILHTILLGVVKYYWGQTVWLLEKSKDFVLFQTRLNSILADGLNIPKIQADYMCQYKGGLIGKHFKTLSQIMAFAVVDLVPPDVLEAWLILGRLTVLLWHTEIDDVESYTVSSLLQLASPSLPLLTDIPLDRARSVHQRLHQYHLQMQPEHSHLQTKIPFPAAPTILHSALWTRSPFFYRAL